MVPSYYTCSACNCERTLLEVFPPAQTQKQEDYLKYVGSVAREFHDRDHPECRVEGSISIELPTIKQEKLVGLFSDTYETKVEEDFRKMGGTIRVFNHPVAGRTKEFVTENWPGPGNTKVCKLMWVRFNLMAMVVENRPNPIIHVTCPYMDQWVDKARQKVSDYYDQWADAGYPYPFNPVDVSEVKSEFAPEE